MYAPGHGESMLAMLRTRTAGEHAAFFLPHLEPGQRLLDVGCSEGVLTRELAAHVAPGRVIGVDADLGITRAAAEAAASSCSTQVRFETALADDLPFADGSFDRIFAHALFEHVPDPPAVVRELHRVLAPGGRLGVASSDWGGALLLPERPALQRTIGDHLAARRAAGGDPIVARHLRSSWPTRASISSTSAPATSASRRRPPSRRTSPTAGRSTARRSSGGPQPRARCTR